MVTKINAPANIPSKKASVYFTAPPKEEGDNGFEDTSLTKILQVARSEWPALFIAFLLMVAAESFRLINPIIVSGAYDALVDSSLSSQERLSDIHDCMLLVMILHFSGIVATFARRAILGIIGERLVARLRNQLYASILKQEMAFFDEHKSGELVSRLGSDTSLLQNTASRNLPEFVLGLIKLWD